jgi:hypothetical protein
MKISPRPETSKLEGIRALRNAFFSLDLITAKHLYEEMPCSFPFPVFPTEQKILEVYFILESETAQDETVLTNPPKSQTDSARDLIIKFLEWQNGEDDIDEMTRQHINQIANNFIHEKMK